MIKRLAVILVALVPILTLGEPVGKGIDSTTDVIVKAKSVPLKTIVLDANEKDIMWVSLNKIVKYNTNHVFVVRNTFSLTNVVGMNFDDIAQLLRDDAERASGATERWKQISRASITEAVEDFLSKNNSNNEFELPTEWKEMFVLISQEEINDIFTEHPDKSKVAVFHQRYPNARGVNTFTRPGISNDGKVAIFCTNVFLNEYFHVLIKKDNKWLFFDRFTGMGWVE